MFTGIIEELGQVRSVEQRGDNARVVIEARLVTQDIHEGDSIAVNGVCLTALSVNKSSFAADRSRDSADIWSRAMLTLAESFWARQTSAVPGRCASRIRLRSRVILFSKAQSRLKELVSP